MNDGVDRYLRSQVNELQDMTVRLGESVSAVSGQVADVHEKQQETRNELVGLRAAFLDFVKQAELTANVHSAQIEISTLEGRLEHEYGHHKVVRRSAVGILQAFDVGLVSEETVRAVSEQLMVQTPRYWLAPVLVALAAWARDEERLCAIAVEEAFRRSPDKTSLFMALLLRRQGRLPSSVRWLRHYLNSQDPTALGRDFAVILEAVSQGAFGPAAVELVHESLDLWRRQLLDDESKQGAQVARWRAEIDAHVSIPADPRYPRLAAVSPQWPQLNRALGCAAAHQALLSKYTTMLAEEVAPTDRLEDSIDEILDGLVGDYDIDELPLRRKLAYNQAVVANEGDKDAAEQTVAESAALDAVLDYLTIQSESALNPSGIGVSRSTQRIAVAACHEWFAQAHAAFCRDYRAALPADVQAVFGGSHSPGALALQFPKWTGSFKLPVPVLERQLAAHWDRHGQAYIDRFVYDWRKPAFITGGCLLGALLLLTVCAGTAGLVIGLVVALVGAGVCALILNSSNRAAIRRQGEARNLVAQSKADSIRQLRAAGAELTDLSTAFRAADQLEPKVRAMIAELATAGHATAPHERRTVLGSATGELT